MAAPQQDAVHWGFQCHQLNIFTEWILGTRDSFNFTQLKVISIDFFVDGFSARSLIEQGRTPVTLSNTSSAILYHYLVSDITSVTMARWPRCCCCCHVTWWRRDVPLPTDWLGPAPQHCRHGPAGVEISWQVNTESTHAGAGARAGGWEGGTWKTGPSTTGVSAAPSHTMGYYPKVNQVLVMFVIKKANTRVY